LETGTSLTISILSGKVLEFCKKYGQNLDKPLATLVKFNQIWGVANRASGSFSRQDEERPTASSG
jgi:hypothetical protein